MKNYTETDWAAIVAKGEKDRARDNEDFRAAWDATNARWLAGDADDAAIDPDIAEVIDDIERDMADDAAAWDAADAKWLEGVRGGVAAAKGNI